jgi:hypothetical protein
MLDLLRVAPNRHADDVCHDAAPVSPQRGLERVRLTALAVYGAWTLATIAALGFVARFGIDICCGDDFDIARALGGEFSWQWLWSLHHEHRLLLPRLVLLALAWLTGDFRAGMVVSVLLLSATALAGIVVSSRLRGRTALTDLSGRRLSWRWAKPRTSSTAGSSSSRLA